MHTQQKYKHYDQHALVPTMGHDDCVYLPAAAATALLVCAIALAGGAALPNQTDTTTYTTSTAAALPPVFLCILTSVTAKPLEAQPSLEAVFTICFSTTFSAFWPNVICSEENVWCGQDIRYQHLSALAAWLLAVVNVYLF
jgi:hypothetical protein